MQGIRKHYLLEVTLDTSKCNIQITEGKILNWIFSWSGNKLKAFSVWNSDRNIIIDPFTTIVNTNGLNLGLLIDALSMIVNLDVNKDIAISTEINALIYELPKAEKPQGMVDMLSLKKGARLVLNAGVIGEERPKRIDDSLSVTLGDEQLRLIHVLLKELEQKTIYSVSDYKLLNYWRRGIDLDNLTLWDESFLAFYKILEYFGKRSNLKKSEIPSKFSSNSLKNGYRIAKGGGLKRVTNKQYEMLSDFVLIRNNWDIAHTRVNMLPKERESALYFTYFSNYWDYYSHISEISRLMILKHLGINKFQLVVEGGLYTLKED